MTGNVDDSRPEQQGDSLTDRRDSEMTFPILDLDELLANPKAAKPQDMRRILTSPNSEDYVTWNVLRALDRMPAADWWPQVVSAARANAGDSGGWDPLSAPPTVDLWRTVSAPGSYERSSRQRMRVSDDDRWRLRSDNPRPVEGNTEVDLVFDGDTYLVFVEAKLHSDISTGTTYDPRRNQIVRNIDCVMEEASGKEPYFWMIVNDRLATREYMKVIDGYRKESDTLCDLLPHRDPRDIRRLVDTMAAITWAEIVDLLPDSVKDTEVIDEIRSRIADEENPPVDLSETPQSDSRLKQILPLSAWEIVDGTLPDDEQIAAAIETLPLTEMERRTIGEFVPGIEALRGQPIQTALAPSVVRLRLLPMLPGTWRELANVTIGEMLSIEGVGVGKVQALLRYTATTVLRQGQTSHLPAPSVTSLDADDVTMALRNLAAWGHVEGHIHLTNAIIDATHGRTGAPVEALAVLDRLDLGAFAGPDLLAAQDPIHQADGILSGFGERDSSILEHRVLTIDSTARWTLARLGSEFPVSRERVRQLEDTIEETLEAAIDDPANRPMRRLVQEIRQDLGTACPIDEAPPIVTPDSSTLTDELFIWYAGPYTLDGDWLVRKGLTCDALVLDAFDRVHADGIAERAAICDELVVSGVHPYLVDRLIDESGELHDHGDRMSRTINSIAGRAILQLRLEGHPMTFQELFDLDDNVENIQSFRNALHRSEDIVLVGNKRVGLTEWGHNEYPGVVRAMVTGIEDAGGSVSIDELASALSGRYVISENSVKIHASSNPLFMLDEGNVALRTAERPYNPKTDLTASRDCFVIDGQWAFRVHVDSDVLRGSGRTMPEAFAVHMGLQPFDARDIDGPAHPVHLNWQHMPTIGSIRLNVLDLGLEEGDYVFIRFTPDDRFEFLPLHAAKVPYLDPHLQLQLLAGGGGSTTRRSWQEILSDALGYRPSSVADADELVDALKSRRQTDLLDIVNGLTASVE